MTDETMTGTTNAGKTTTRVRVARGEGARRGAAATDERPDAGQQTGQGAAAPGILAQTEQVLEGWAGQVLPRSWRASRTIPVDEWRDTTDWVVEAEIPGVDPDRDVTLRLDRHVLELQADRCSTAAQHGSSTRRELRSGRLTRTLAVPRGARPEGAGAVYRDGILTVRVPITPEEGESSRTLTVTRG